MNENKEIKISAQVETIDQAKELLADLEVLNKKYDVKFYITCDPVHSNYEPFDR